MNIAVVLPFHHRIALLEKAIDSLQGIPCYVVNDGPLRLGKGPFQVVEHPTPDQGFAASANTGLAHAQCDGYSWVLLLNDDATIDPQSVQKLVNKIGPEVGAIGPVITYPNGVQSAGIAVSSWGRIKNIQQPPYMDSWVDALCGACMLVPSWVRFDAS